MPEALLERTSEEVREALSQLRSERQEFTESVVRAATPAIREVCSGELAREIDIRVRRDQEAITAVLLAGLKRQQAELVEEAASKLAPQLRQVNADALAAHVAPLVGQLMGHQVKQLARLVEEARPSVNVDSRPDMSRLEELFAELSAKSDLLIQAVLQPKPRSVVMTDSEGRRVEGELR